MWVDTKGEDGPQCRHDTPEGALLAQPPPHLSCKSLLYALQSISNSTSIRVTCGTHEYFKSSTTTLPAGAKYVQIVGECSKEQPTVRVLNGSNLELHGITRVVVRELVIETWGKHGDLQLANNNSILYISNCTDVGLRSVMVRISAPRGIGILLRHTAADGNIILYNVSILHSGTHGTGIHCNILREAQSTAEYLTLNMSHVLVVNTNTATSFEPGMTFSGIIVTTYGSGSGSLIVLRNVTVFNSAPVAGSGILVRFLDGVHNSDVALAGVNVLDGWNEHYHNRSRDKVFAECIKRQHDMLNMTTGALENYSAIMVDVHSSLNTIYVMHVRVSASYAPSGSAVAVYFKGMANSNFVLLGNVSLSATGNTIAHRRGLEVQFAGNTSENKVKTEDLQVANSTAESGGGAFLLFTDHCALNEVVLWNSIFTNHSSKHGGGLFVLFQGCSQNNSISLQHMSVENNTAELGAGIFVVMDDFSKGNTFDTYDVVCYGNRAKPQQSQMQYDRSVFKNHSVARYGGGFAALFLGHTENNAVTLVEMVAEDNTAELGGGIAISLDDFTRGNVITIQNVSIIRNKAYAGGGIYINFHYLSERNTITLTICEVLSNDLIPHSNFYTQGGGMQVLFDNNKATGATNNVVLTRIVTFGDNNARDGVGGGLSVLYVHSPEVRVSGDKVCLNRSSFWNNLATNGQAIALQSFPKYRKALFTGVILSEISIMSIQNVSSFLDIAWSRQSQNPFFTVEHLTTVLEDVVFVQLPKMIMKWGNPIYQVTVNRNMIFLVSVQVTIENWLKCFCGGLSQGILAIDSEVNLQLNSRTSFAYCVASHGGGVALYGESYIRFPFSSAELYFIGNHAFQRGGALYVDSTHSVQSRFHCFLQSVHGKEQVDDSVLTKGLVFIANSAGLEGKSVYISDDQSCYKGDAMSQLSIIESADRSCMIRLLVFESTNSSTCVYQVYFFQENENMRRFEKCVGDSFTNCSGSKKFLPWSVSQEVLFHPNHVDGPPDRVSGVVNVQFTPGIPKQLPYWHAYDKLGNVIKTAFTVQIISQQATVAAPVELDPLSQYTDNFIVILHGVPLQHGMFNKHSFSSGTSNTSTAEPLLVLQSVDNKHLILVMKIQLQCCPPGYVFQNSSKNGTCHCGMLTAVHVKGIAECNEADPNAVSAVLLRGHWAGYLPSNDQHSCGGQKFFSASCPTGYCNTQQTSLPNNNSKQLLEEVVCGGSKRKGILCGECLEENSIAVNFNGILPVCVSCQEGLSRVGVLVWVLSEWVPMLIVMFIVMLFNVDLISGQFNSFLLFAQLLAFSSIRGNNAEMDSVHIAFVKIYRFLYGMWSLDFFGVLLPPYCLIPQAQITLLQTLLLHYSVGLFPLTVAITLTVLERSAEKWICCHRLDQCLRRMRRWKAKYSDGMSYDRALPAFVILGFTRFLVTSTYILVNQTITGEDGEVKVVVWWQGSLRYGSIEHIAYFIPAVAILLVFVLLPSFLLLTLPIGPQLFGRLIIAVPALRKLQRMQTFCSNVYTDRWVYHFVNVFQGCYKERFRSFSSLYLFYRIIQLLAAVFIPRAEDALRIQLFLTLVLMLVIVVIQPYTSNRLNTLDAAIVGNMALILVLDLLITDLDTSSGMKQFYTAIQMILIYLPLLYPTILFGRKVYLKCAQWRCCQKQDANTGNNAEPLLLGEDPAARLGNLVNITELRAGLPPSSEDDDSLSTSSKTV